MSKKRHTSHVAIINPDADSVEPTTQLPLREAVFIYGERDNTLAVRHKVRPSGTLSTGELLDSTELARTLLDLAAQREVERLSYLPEHVLASGRHATVWWRPAGPAALWFKTHDSRLTTLNGKPVPLPALVFRTDGRSLKVWALARSVRPSPDTPLWHAPFMNLFAHDDGASVCLGDARSPNLRKAAGAAESTQEWERLFFESNFTHTPPRINPAAGVECYAELLEWAMKKGEFPSSLALIQTKQTLTHALA